MIERLNDRRARFLLHQDNRADVAASVDPLKDAPLRVRRLGLPMAVAMWSRDGHDKLTAILRKWLFEDWGMLSKSSPQTAEAFLDRLMEIEEESPELRSAIEVEAEAFLQAAKIISSAMKGSVS